MRVRGRSSLLNDGRATARGLWQAELPCTPSILVGLHPEDPAEGVWKH